MFREIGKSISGALFFISLSFLVFLFSLKNLTQYDVIKPMATDIIKRQLISEQNISIEEVKPNLINYCQFTGNKSLELSFSFVNLTLECSRVYSSSSEEIVNYVSSQVFDYIYNRRYECEFLECMTSSEDKDKVMLLLSSKANEFFSRAFNYSLISTLFFGFILAICCRKVEELFRSFGIPLFFLGISYLSMNYLSQKFLPSDFLTNAQPFLNKILQPFPNFYLILISTGSLLLVISFLIPRLKKSK